MTPEKQRMVLLAGYSAAGKSTIGRELRDKWGYNLIEHQPLIHDLASSRGYERTRYWLAEVGTNQFADESTKEMVVRARNIFNAGEAKVVFDVAYGIKMLEVFRNEFPNIYLLVISIIADENIRVKNIQKRMGTESIDDAKKELHFRDKFLHDVGLDSVLQQRDIEIANMNKPVEDIASELNKLIEEHLQNR